MTTRKLLFANPSTGVEPCGADAYICAVICLGVTYRSVGLLTCIGLTSSEGFLTPRLLCCFFDAHLKAAKFNRY
jgi:hypothetical protein